MRPTTFQYRMAVAEGARTERELRTVIRRRHIMARIVDMIRPGRSRARRVG